MTKKDLLTELIEELNSKKIIADKDINLAIGIAMGVFTGFSIIADPYLLENE